MCDRLACRRVLQGDSASLERAGLSTHHDSVPGRDSEAREGVSIVRIPCGYCQSICPQFQRADVPPAELEILG